MTRHAGVLKKDLQEVNRRLYFFLVKVKVKSLSRVRLYVTPWTVAYQAPPSMGFSRQEYWSGLPFPSPGGLPDPGIEPKSSTLEADALTSEPPGKSIFFYNLAKYEHFSMFLYFNSSQVSFEKAV